jgi:hypothetical protein
MPIKVIGEKTLGGIPGVEVGSLVKGVTLYQIETESGGKAWVNPSHVIATDPPQMDLRDENGKPLKGSINANAFEEALKQYDFEKRAKASKEKGGTSEVAGTPVDKAAAKAGFLAFVDEQLKTATGKAKEGYEFIKEHAEKVDINNDGKADLTQIKELAKAGGTKVMEGFDIAGKKLTEFGRAAYEVGAPIVEEAADKAAGFGKDNMWGLLAAAGVALLGMIMGLGPLASIVLGFVIGAITGMFGDKNGAMKGPGQWVKNKLGLDGESKEHEQERSTGTPEAGKTTGQDVGLTPAAKELAEIARDGYKVDVVQKNQDVTITYKTVEEGRLSTTTAKGTLGDDHHLHNVHVTVVAGKDGKKEFDVDAIALPVDGKGNVDVPEAKKAFAELMKEQSATTPRVADVPTGQDLGKPATPAQTTEGQQAHR